MFQKESMAAVASVAAAASAVEPDIDIDGAGTGQSAQSIVMVNGLAFAPVGTLWFTLDHFFQPD